MKRHSTRLMIVMLVGTVVGTLLAMTPLGAQSGRATGQKGRAAAPSSTAALRNPARLKDVAPATFRAAFDSSVGNFVVEVHRDWAPKGADRFYNMVKYGFLDGCRFFRVMRNFVVQFGINGNPAIQSAWRKAVITDDPVKQSNKRGTIVFATAGPNSRTTQLFINLRDNARLDLEGFSPIGTIVSGMEVVDKINAQYGDRPDQDLIQRQGNAYLNKAFPKLDFIKSATIAK